MLAIYLRGMSGQTADPGSCVASPQTDGKSLKKVQGGSGWGGAKALALQSTNVFDGGDRFITPSPEGFDAKP